MDYSWLDHYLLGKPGAEKDYKVEWDAVRYMIRGKMFAMSGSNKDGKPIITMKLEPQHGELLRNQYRDIVPGYYMNKEHWNSIYLDGEVPGDVMKTIADESHRLILSALPKKAQREIMGE